MLGFLFYLLLFSLAVEATVELLVKSQIFKPIRDSLSGDIPIVKFFRSIFSCGYCMSVWASVLPAVWLTYNLGNFTFMGSFMPARFLLFLLLIHRASNYLHDFHDKILDKFYSKNHNSLSDL